jgi:hypothetical protein
MCFNAFDKEADLDVLDHPVLNLFYYLVCMKFAKHEIKSPAPVWQLRIDTYYNSDVPLFLPSFLQLVEILPSSLVLYILRRIPAKLRLSQYHPVSSS